MPKSAYTSTECPLNIDQSHRGSQLHPENTLEAVVTAFDQGLASVEVDVQRLADGTWVLHHDPIIGRVVRIKGLMGKSASTLNGSEWHSGHTFDKDGNLSPSKPALLSDVVEHAKLNGGHLNIEIKSLYSCDELSSFVQTIQSIGNTNQLMISSVDQSNLSCIRKIWHEVPVAWVIAPSARTIKAQYSKYANQFSSLGRVLGFSIQNLLLKAEQHYEAKNRQTLSSASVSKFATQFSRPAAVHVDQNHLLQYDWLASLIKTKGLNLGVYNITRDQARTLKKHVGYCPTWAIVDH